MIPALLNQIIYPNEIGFKISGIEGDAVLFYRTGELPSFEKLIVQCKNFYADFYKRIEELKKTLETSGKADLIPKMLGLKIILHHGTNIGMAPIGKHIKLMGEDVIVAHRLLKNNLDIDEYILISEEVLKKYLREEIRSSAITKEIMESEMELEHLGKISFSYMRLSANVVDRF